MNLSKPSRKKNCLCLATINSPSPGGSRDISRAGRSEVNVYRCRPRWLGVLVVLLVLWFMLYFILVYNLYLRYLLVFLYVWLQLMLVVLFEVNTYFGGLDLVFHTPIFEATLPVCPFHLLGWYETCLECHSRFGVVFPIIDSIIYFTNQFFSSFIPVVFQTPRVMLEYVQLLILWPPRNQPRH